MSVCMSLCVSCGCVSACMLSFSTSSPLPSPLKVADFGLSIFNDANPLKKQMMTWQWLAPETIRTTKEGYGWKSDVYSYGVMMYEVVTRNFPYLDDYGDMYQNRHWFVLWLFCGCFVFVLCLFDVC